MAEVRRWQVTLTVVAVDSSQVESLRVPPEVKSSADLFALLSTLAPTSALTLKVYDDSTVRFRPKAGKPRGSGGFYVCGKVSF